MYRKKDGSVLWITKGLYFRQDTHEGPKHRRPRETWHEASEKPQNFGASLALCICRMSRARIYFARSFETTNSRGESAL